MRPPTAQQTDVVHYWRLLELFNPQQVPRTDPANPESPIVDWTPGRPLPWEVLAPPPPARRAGTTREREWQHTVYLGLYAIEAVYEHLHRVFPRDEDAYDERANGSSACASILVDAGGRMVPDTAVLSSAVWAVGRTVDPGVGRQGWSVGFDLAGVRFAEALAERLAPSRRRAGEPGTALHESAGPLEPPRLDGAILADLVGLAHAQAGVRGLAGLSEVRVRVTSRAVVRDPGDASPPQAQDFLNSFFLDDLLTVAGSDWGGALHEYLTPAADVPVEDRVDVRADPAAVVGGTRPERLPAGRWPSDPDEHLATSQQFAVNEAFSSLGTSRSLMAVNGPPGTGKTTMLRDVLAGNVVRRAQVLAGFDAPADAFTADLHRWKAGDYRRTIRVLRPEVTGFEMLLASSNNAAVQNVSDELPRQEAIHDPDGVADYFGDLAAEVASRQRAKGSPQVTGPSWGMVAARLGNSGNRNAFRSAFWFGKNPGREGGDDGVIGFQELLKGWESQPASQPSWSGARSSFERARTRVEGLVAQRVEAQRRFEREREVVEELAAAEARTAELQSALRSGVATRRAVALRLQPLESAVQDRAAVRQRHRDTEPGWLEKILHRGSTRTWRHRLDRLEDDLVSAEGAARAVRHEVEDLDAAVERTRAEEDAWAITGSRLAALAETLGDAVHEDLATWGGAHPASEHRADDEGRELRAAWLDRDLDQARSELFFEALSLHRAFWAGAPDVRKHLQASLEVVTGEAPRSLSPEVRRAAWQLLFLAVPLVSTTFASVGRMLHGLGPAALGWLLVDEAGQATPQAAVGAMWRAQRVLAVGDPMQLTPVVTVPRRAQEDIAAALGLGEGWAPSTTSVQQLADRVSRYGTRLTGGLEPLWVGAPLRVHRRCASPMFDVSNRIAYEGLMISAVGDRRDGVPALPASCWYDVPAVDAGSHLQRAEIRRLEELLADLPRKDVEMRDVIAVSPFRAVATALVGVREDHPGLVAGTIHTAQGKEADVVFLVLGGDPAKPGAKRWAASSPNLVNVAVTRAKHRLYVVGDRSAWSQHPFFDDLERALRASR